MTQSVIIANGFALTCDQDNRGGRLHVLVQDGRIAEVATSLDALTGQQRGIRVIDATGKLLLPGFVNAHVHSDSLFHRVQTVGKHALVWQQDKAFVSAAARFTALSREEIDAAYQSLFAAHLRSGTTTVGEFPPPLDDRTFLALLQSADRCRTRTVTALQSWDQIVRASELGTARPPCVINLGTPGDFTIYSFENLVRAAKQQGFPLLAHVAETREDAETVRKNFRKDTVSLLRDMGALNPGTLVAHANHCADQEVRILEDLGIPLVLCARSAAGKQTGFPSLRSINGRNIFLCLGTDWGSLDMIREMHFCAHLPMLLPGISGFSPMEVIRMATVNGAYALGVDADTGSLQRGKRADITFFDLSDIRLPLLPPHPTTDDLALLVVRDLTAANVCDVMVGGEFVVHKGVVTGANEHDLMAGVRRIHAKLYPGDESVPGEEPERSAPKVIQFVPDTKRSEADVESFESGFAPRTTAPDEPAEPQPWPKPRKKEPRSPQLPELSKDVRRVFGEDDDY